MKGVPLLLLRNSETIELAAANGDVVRWCNMIGFRARGTRKCNPMKRGYDNHVSDSHHYPYDLLRCPKCSHTRDSKREMRRIMFFESIKVHLELRDPGLALLYMNVYYCCQCIEVFWVRDIDRTITRSKSIASTRNSERQWTAQAQKSS